MILTIDLLISEDENLTISFKPEKKVEPSKEGYMLESTLFNINLLLKEVRQCNTIGINNVWIITGCEWYANFQYLYRLFNSANFIISEDTLL